jgi:hypothetical protein
MPRCLLPCCPRTMLPLDLLFTIPFTWIVSAGIGNTHGDDGRTALGVECLGLLKLVRACVGHRQGTMWPGWLGRLDQAECKAGSQHRHGIVLVKSIIFVPAPHGCTCRDACTAWCPSLMSWSTRWCWASWPSCSSATTWWVGAGVKGSCLCSMSALTQTQGLCSAWDSTGGIAHSVRVLSA